MNESILPQKQRLFEVYSSYNTDFTNILGNIENKLKDTLHLVSMPTFKTRIKSFRSYYKKILRQKSDEARTSQNLVTLTDMMGIRVICAFLEDLEEVEKQICANFDVKEIERKGAEQSFREFGYESVHILVAIPKDCIPEDLKNPLPEDLVCEIQVRTILQDAWAEVEHELIYKSEFNPFDKPLRRKLASINASLTLADMVFQEIRDYQNRLQNELGTRRNTFYKKADLFAEEEFASNGLKAAQGASETITTPFVSGSIDDMVLRALHEHNEGNFEMAIKIYTKILESKPEPNKIVLGVIFKHRGMAYFAQNKYEQALSDFKSSEENDPKGFRAIYYEGIVYSVLEKNKEAVDCFTRSLEIDRFQTHVYFRRSLAYYNLGEYAKAMEDINGAINLGLDDEDVRMLKEKIIKKFDMGM